MHGWIIRKRNTDKIRWMSVSPYSKWGGGDLVISTYKTLDDAIRYAELYETRDIAERNLACYRSIHPVCKESDLEICEVRCDITII